MAFCKHNGGGLETCPACKRESSNSAVERFVMAGCDIRAVVPLLDQRQDSIKDQLADLLTAGNRLGLYDAVEWVRSQWDKNRP